MFLRVNNLFSTKIVDELDDADPIHIHGKLLQLFDYKDQLDLY